MFRPRFIRDRKGVSGAVTAMLIILIMSAMVTVIYNTYVPVWTKDAEANHIKEVMGEFLDMKANIDSQIINAQEGEVVTMSSNIQLGEPGGPVLGFGEVRGALSYNPLLNRMRLYDRDTGDEYGLARGNITYTTHNREFVNQRFIYEHGAVVIAQWKGMSETAIMKVTPNIHAYKDSAGRNVISAVIITFFGDEESVSGTNTVAVKSTLYGVAENTYDETTWPFGKNLTLEVTSEFPQVWYDYFTESLAYNSSGMSQRVAGSGDYNITQVGNTVVVRFWDIAQLTIESAKIKVDVE